MNWIETIFGKKEQSSPEIRFDELPVWLESRFEKISRELGRNSASLYSDIEDALEDIKKSTALLEEAQPEGRFHLKMVKIAASNRDNMIKQVRVILENIAVPQTSDIKTIRRFYESAFQTLTVCLENMMKSYQYTKMVFLEESKQVIADVNMLGRLLNQLIEPINDKKNVLDAFENAGKAIESIKNISYDIEIVRKEIEEKEESIVLLRKEILEKQEALAHLKAGESWERYLNNKKELAQLENNIKGTESEIIALVLPLNKALTRLKQLSESGRYTLKPQIREGMYLCLSDPKSVDPDFFIEFFDIIKSNPMNLAPEKKDKMLQQMKPVLSSFESYKKQYQNLVLAAEKKKNEISKMSISREETDLTSRIKSLDDGLAASEKELGTSKGHLESLKNNLELKSQELQQMISIIDNRMRVSF